MLDAGRAPRWWRQVGVLWGKEMRLEAAQKTRLRALVPFALLVLLLFSFAVGPQARLLARLAGGMLWLAVLFATVLSLAESMRTERADGALEGLRLLGVSPSALFVAKAASNALFVLLLTGVLLPATIALYDAPLQAGCERLLPVLLLGSAALSAPGTLFATLASEARAKDMLLPLLLFPLLVPALLGAVRATQLALFGDPMAEYGLWLGLLLTFNALFWPLCALCFERVLEA